MPERESQQQFLKQSETFSATTGDEMIGKRLNLYFEEVIDMIGYSKGSLDFFANIEHMEIMRNLGQGGRCNR